MNKNNPYTEACFLCGTDFQFGEHIYAGKPLNRFGISVCNICKDANADGLGPGYEKKFLKHLEENGLSIPDRSEKGLLLLWGSKTPLLQRDAKAS